MPPARQERSEPEDNIRRSAGDRVRADMGAYGLAWPLLSAKVVTASRKRVSHAQRNWTEQLLGRFPGDGAQPGQGSDGVG